VVRNLYSRLQWSKTSDLPALRFTGTLQPWPAEAKPLDHAELSATAARVDFGNPRIVDLEDFRVEAHAFLHIEDHYGRVLALGIANRPLPEFEALRVEHHRDG